jgi:hypothetical protein
MGKPIMKFLLLAAAATVVSTAVLADAPAMTIGSLETALSQEDCIAKGTSVMKGAGLTKNFEVVGRTIYGETDNYTGAIRCESGKAIVLFVVAGPESKNTTEIQAKLKAAFDTK